MTLDESGTEIDHWCKTALVLQDRMLVGVIRPATLQLSVPCISSWTASAPIALQIVNWREKLTHDHTVNFYSKVMMWCMGMILLAMGCVHV